MESELPKILAGPIIRRTTFEEVNIWLATSIPFPQYPEEVRLELFNTDEDYFEFPTLDEESFSRSVQLGKNLFLHIITAVPIDNLPFGVPIAYDIVIKNKLSSQKKSFLETSDLKQIILKGFKLPTFILPDPDFDFHAIYGSCRKLHGPPPDMMIAVDKIINEKPDGRPNYLFLGGDQIYADDVAQVILNRVFEFGKILIGREESIPGLPKKAVQPSSRPYYLNNLLKTLSSTHKNFHLLTFGDYIATYLLAWNGSLWAEVEKFQLPFENLRPKIVSDKGSFSSRRILANCITYMIFDDHEVTDDWFLNSQWRKQVLAHKPVKRIITNGMAAYALFQGWGNNPKSFNDNILNKIGNFALKGINEDEATKELLNHSWSFLAPTSPPTLFLDTRTNRAESPKIKDKNWVIVPNERVPNFIDNIKTRNVNRNSKAPRLLGERERNIISNSLLTQVKSDKPLIIVAASPIFGFKPLEEIQEAIGKFSPETGDLESWAANSMNLIDIVSLILESSANPIIILSGDVHYGFEISISITAKNTSKQVVQFCSSAIKNRPEGGQKFFLKYILDRFRRDILNLPIGWWFIPKNDDGHILRFPISSFNSELSNLLKNYGHPKFIINEKLRKRNNNEGVVTENNIGELKIDNQVNKIFHRFWRGDNDNFQSDDYFVLSLDDWPTKNIHVTK